MQKIPYPKGNALSSSQGEVESPAFLIACWVLFLIAFTQLVFVCTALSTRESTTDLKPRFSENLFRAPKAPMIILDRPKAPQTKAKSQKTPPPAPPAQTRSLDEILLSVDDGGKSDSSLPTKNSEITLPISLKNRLASSPPIFEKKNDVPHIADPRVERLVSEARDLHLDGDLMRAMLKIEEAEDIDAREPAVMHQKALLLERMGMFVKAADSYQKIQNLGISAGYYYRVAVDKLAQGMETALPRKSKLTICSAIARPSSQSEHENQTQLIVSVLARSGVSISASDVQVNIYFYDRLSNGKIEKSASNAIIESSWVDQNVDWSNTGNVELYKTKYSIPELDYTTRHLIGRREFYGFVVELLYQGEVVDQLARPRHLHSEHARSMFSTEPNPQPFFWNINHPDTLLPKKD